MSGVPHLLISDIELSGSEVGSGSFGAVQLGVIKEDGRKVAVKRIHPGTDEVDQSYRTWQMQRELKITSVLDHPNVIKLFAVADPIDKKKDPHVTYMVMEQAHHDLRGLMESKVYADFLSQGVIKGIVKQMLMGLAYCHARSVMHRDLKPENIVMTQDGTIKLIDFGLARCDDPRAYGKYTNSVVTFWYRAPELLLGAREYSFSIDIWSIGCIAAELLLQTVLFSFRESEPTEQLACIWKTCGTPLENGWPEASQLPLWQEHIAASKQVVMRDFQAQFRTNNHCRMQNYFTNEFVTLLDGLLQLKPSKRMSCVAALNMPWFKGAFGPEKMPKWTQSLFGKLEKKKRHKGPPLK